MAFVTSEADLLHCCVNYDFSYSQLENAFHLIFPGISHELSQDEPAGTAMLLSNEFRLDRSEESFNALQTILTLRHEEFHIRHLTGSPLAMMLYMIMANKQHSIGRYLKHWGMNTGTDLAADMNIPLAVSNANHDSIRQVLRLSNQHDSAFKAIMGGSEDWPEDQASSACETALQIIQSWSEQHMGFRDHFPSVGRMANLNIGLCPKSLNGYAVAEGLARCDEYLNATKFTHDPLILNRVFLLKHFGPYGLAIEVVRRILNLDKATDATIMTFFCSDWAIQIPGLPFLLRNREKVSLEELLPGCRFFLLVSLCGSRKVSSRDISTNPTAVAEELFSALGWDDPWTIAKRIGELEMPSPRDPMLCHYFESMRTCAKLRLSNLNKPLSLDSGQGSHLLSPLFCIYTDRLTPGSTGKFLPQLGVQPVVEQLILDITMASVLYEKNMQRPYQLIRLQSEFLKRLGESKDMDEYPGGSLNLLHDYVSVIVGANAASRIMALQSPFCR